MAGTILGGFSDAAFKFGFTSLTIVVACIAGLLILGIIWLFIRWRNYRKCFRGTALIIGADGTFLIDRIGKIRDKDQLDKCKLLNSKETMPVIESNKYRGGKIVLYRYAPGQFAIIPWYIFERADLKKFNIELINMQMKNFAYMEQRAAITRWAFIKDQIQKYAPFITIIILCVVAGVVIWILAKVALDFNATAIGARIMECKEALGVPSTPTG